MRFILAVLLLTVLDPHPCRVSSLSPPDEEFNSGKTKESWSYDLIPGANGPDEWETLNSQWNCNGRKQSPINIDTEAVIERNPTPPNIQITIEPEGSPVTGELVNNGYAPTFIAGAATTVRLSGGNLLDDYFLKQFHFHFGCNDSVGSEHLIDGNPYPVELQMVFWDNKHYSTFDEAARGENGLALVAVLFELNIGNQSNSPQSTLERLTKRFTSIVEEGSAETISKNNGIIISNLAPLLFSHDLTDKYYKYQGSLTTPGCYESVTWFVMNTHPVITQNELGILRALKSSKTHPAKKDLSGKMCNNFRPPAAMDGRMVFSNIV